MQWYACRAAQSKVLCNPGAQQGFTRVLLVLVAAPLSLADHRLLAAELHQMLMAAALLREPLVLLLRADGGWHWQLPRQVAAELVLLPPAELFGLLLLVYNSQP